jgi:intracellular multiplication protein IcmG
MDIDTNKSADEEEYRPADYDASVFEATPTSSSVSSSTLGSSRSTDNKAANILEHLKRKNIIIALVAIVGIFCVYKIIDVLFTPGVPHKTVAPRAEMPKPIQMQTQAPTAPMPVAATNQMPVAAESVVNRLNTLEQQINTEQSNLASVSNQINDLQSSISNVDSKISSLTASLQAMADIVAKQQASLAAKQAKQKAINAAPKPIYYVKAMVPGRAWITTGNGETLTVSLGNNLPGYGRVEVIDPTQGTLITSSGAIIGYSPGDS